MNTSSRDRSVKETEEHVEISRPYWLKTIVYITSGPEKSRVSGWANKDWTALTLTYREITYNKSIIEHYGSTSQILSVYCRKRWTCIAMFLI